MGICAKDLMHRDVAVVEASASLAELERSFAEAKVSGFPVVDRGLLVGVVSRADVVTRLGSAKASGSSYYVSTLEPGDVFASFEEAAASSGTSTDHLRVQDLMTHSIVAVAPDASLQTVARTLMEHRVHRTLVVDGGQLVGIVASLDLVGLIAEGALALD